MTMKRSMIYNLLAQGSVFVFGLFNAVLSAQVLGTEGKGQLAIYLLAIDMGIVTSGLRAPSSISSSGVSYPTVSPLY